MSHARSEYEDFKKIAPDAYERLVSQATFGTPVTGR